MDKVLLFSIFSLFSICFISVYAAVHEGNMYIWQKQNIYWIIGIIILIIVSLIPIRKIAFATWGIYLIALILLLLVPLIGDTNMGAKRWINLGIVNIQPSEVMKWGMMLALAYYYASREANNIKNVFISFIFAAIPAGLIVQQPDLGTALVLLFTGAFIILAAGFPWRWLFALTLSSPVFLYILWNNMKDYQKGRVMMFLDPQQDPLDKGYHVIQSSIAIGSGGLFGKGFLEGTQSRLHFLPEQHTDFIFAVIAEQGGLLAGVVLLCLYTLLIGRIIYISSIASSRFASLICIGVAAIFTLYVFINIGMVSGILPVVGVPLPFISYGGTSLITVLAASGLVMRVYIESKNKIPWQRPGNPLS
ncbi:MAG: rod shape-determining protein RodA [Zetaproteobacteria bacterium]|nr:rod shape-determining protein RodA [Zetaproteobacteria bacterium]